MDTDARPSSTDVDNTGTTARLNIDRAVGLARALAALVDAGATALARPLAHELLGALEAAQGEVAQVVHLGAARARKGA